MENNFENNNNDFGSEVTINNEEIKAPNIRSARKKEGKGLRIFLIIAICLLSVAIVLVLVGKITGLGDFGRKKPNDMETTTHNPIMREDGSYAERVDEVYNFLLVGQDLKANLTDVMMIINFDASQGKMTLMQIPRISA